MDDHQAPSQKWGRWTKKNWLESQNGHCPGGLVNLFF
jgi:hypothetical protein